MAIDIKTRKVTGKGFGKGVETERKYSVVVPEVGTYN
jgi:hypothetical protein